MLENFEPFIQVEFEVCFCGRSEVATSPAATFTVGYGATNRATGGEEKEVDVGIYLGDDAELSIELSIECLEWNVCAQGAICNKSGSQYYASCSKGG